MKTFSPKDRLLNIEKMKRQEFDLVIIGGGINGAGIARDASSRGMSVALIEAHDFASGTSSRSSKLIHGGIRYLENYEFKLVFEALNERTRLFEMAPHLVHPLRFMLPVYKGGRVGMFLMGLGMWAYDALSLFQAPEMHEHLDVEESMDRMTALRQEDLLGSYVYSDAYMDDDRLVYETLRSAHEKGAVCASYVKASGAQFNKAGQISAITCEDQITHEKFTIKARHVVSSVGPWTDAVASSILPDWKKVLRPTKGIHLTLAKNRLPLQCAVVMAAEKEDRIVFGIPRHEMIIIGTTDTDYKGSPDDVNVTPEDVTYLLKIVDHYFPGAKITAHDVIASYAGVRPLVDDGASTEGKTSREHTIINDPRGITFIAGGKYTTYRLVSEQVVDACLHFLPLEKKVQFKKANTSTPLNPMASVDAFHQADIQSDVWADVYKRRLEDVEMLASRYGMEAEKILQKYPPHYTYWQLEAAQAVDNTMCMHLVDFYSRRVHLFLADRNHGLKFIDEIGLVFQEKLRWSDAQLAEEKHRLTDFMAVELAWKKSF